MDSFDAPPAYRISAPDSFGFLRMATPRELLDRLDTRHDELIRKLDELNAEIEATLVQFTKSRSEASQSHGAATGMEPGGVTRANQTTTRRAA